MAKKQGNNKLLIGIVIIFVAVVSIFAIFMFNNSSDDNEFNPLSTSFDYSQQSVLLDFCNYESDCLNYLNANGMPPGFLESEGYNINCQNGDCYITKS